MLEEVNEHFKYPGLDSNQLAGAARLAALHVEFVVVKTVNHMGYPGVLPQPFPREGSFYIKHSKPSSRSSCTTSSGPTLTGMVRIRPDMVNMWSRRVVSNTVHWQEEPSTVRGHMGSGLWLETAQSRKGTRLLQC
jgi:hypothetical protein